MGVLVILLLLLLIVVALWFYKKLLLWVLFSPDYLLIIGAVGAYTVDHVGWLTSSQEAHYIWAILAMLVVGLAYHFLNRRLYMQSPRLYAVISFPVVVAASLVIMLTLVLRVVEEVAPNLADNPTTRHIIYVCIGVVIALVAWFKRQSTMARVCPPTPDGGIEDNPTAYQTPAPPNDAFQQIDDTTIPQPH
ncbi:hypothetical protein [Schaalia meyeri]|uniref:hypothetical protein n=1 Tax=Schaalia meyeri TaxID=52773 RepID=UPI00067FBD81|nr:hypothetical protein [Schaalia meyeri]